jgi:phosphomannomutase
MLAGLNKIRIGESSVSDKLLLSVAGARGIVGKTIDEDIVSRLTHAFCSILPDGPVVVGRDTRPSGESFLRSVVDAVTSAGRDCIDLGIATTPTVEMITESSEAVGGVIVTASHNPVEWNALKFIDHRGIFLTSEVGENLKKAFDAATGPIVDRAAGRVSSYAMADREHIDAILALDVIDVEMIRRQRFKVVLDCINGAGSVIAPRLLGELGADVIAINCTPNGDFFRDPEPRPENLRELAERVRGEGAVVGFACDPDGDRLALVDDKGRAISEEYTLGLAIDHVLSHTQGPVVVNMSTSALIDHVAGRHGVGVHRTPVGEAHVVARLLAEGAVIGGEGNGGVIYPRLHPGRDALLGMALILQLLAERDTTLSEQVHRYPPFHISKDKVELGGRFSPERISLLLGELNPDTIDMQDGVKALFSDGWFHLRVSNTEGVVRVIAEAHTAEHSRELQAQARKILQSSWE